MVVVLCPLGTRGLIRLDVRLRIRINRNEFIRTAGNRNCVYCSENAFQIRTAEANGPGVELPGYKGHGFNTTSRFFMVFNPRTVLPLPKFMLCNRFLCFLSIYTARSENELDVLYVTCQGFSFAFYI